MCRSNSIKHKSICKQDTLIKQVALHSGKAKIWSYEQEPWISLKKTYRILKQASLKSPVAPFIRHSLARTRAWYPIWQALLRHAEISTTQLTPMLPVIGYARLYTLLNWVKMWSQGGHLMNEKGRWRKAQTIEKMEPAIRVERTTCWLRISCSTTELRRRNTRKMNKKGRLFIQHSNVRCQEIL